LPAVQDGVRLLRPVSLSRPPFPWWTGLDKAVVSAGSLRYKAIFGGVGRTVFTGRLGHDVVTVRCDPNGSRMRYCRLTCFGPQRQGCECWWFVGIPAC